MNSSEPRRVVTSCYGGGVSLGQKRSLVVSSQLPLCFQALLVLGMRFPPRHCGIMQARIKPFLKMRRVIIQ
jgi:hypothetical protein